MFEKELQKLGLSDKEAKFYLASLRLGKSPVQEIAEQAGVNRGTAYNIIKSLMEKGLMSSFDQGKKTYFTAESPERLISLIRTQERDLQIREKELNDFLPEIQAIYDLADNKPKVKYYEGLNGLLAMQEEYLRTKSKKIDNISSLDSFLKVMPNVGKSYTPRRIEKGVRSRFLYVTKNGPDKSLANSDKKELRESKHIPYEKFPFESDIAIFDNKISLESYSKNGAMGVIIENEGIADSMRAIFNYLWAK
jgi:sugar-specific transcriptional regulator TrmB